MRHSLYISALYFVSIFAFLNGCSQDVPPQEASINVLPSPVKEAEIRVGPNMPIRSRASRLPIVEPHISAYPMRNDHLLVAAMEVTDPNRPYESCRLLSFVSTDGGQNWTETIHDYWGYDPWTAILPDGYTTMSWIGTKGSFRDDYPVVLFRSHDGGMTWNEQVQTLPGNHDGTKIVLSPNLFLFSTIFFRGHMDAVLRIYSSQDKSPFQMSGSIDGKGEHVNFTVSAILTDNTIVVPLSIYKKHAWVQTSSDRGRTFSNAYKITEKLGDGKGYFHLVADTGNGRFKDRLYFIRAAGYGKNYEGIFANYSTDRGKSWSSDQRVDLFQDRKNSRAMVPTATVNHNGVLGVVWVDSQGDALLNKRDVYFTVSFDGGVTFQKAVRITDVSSDPATDANADAANKFPGGGHYIGITARGDGSFQPVWSDSRSGVFQLQTCNIQLRK